jgi:phosphoglycerate dehydrogenase-like enzyme
MRVAILNDIHRVYETSEGVRRLRERAEVRVFTGASGEASALRGYDALVANRERTRFTRELLAQLPDLRIIAQTGNHAYHIDLDAAAERGVIVGKAAGGFSAGAAELAIGLMIAVMRGIPAVDAAVKQGGWPRPMTPVLHGKTLGIVGLGRIGRHVATVARAFGMTVLAWGRTLSADSAASVGASRCELDDMLRASDVVSIHATLGPESRGLIDASRLALMKPSAYLINTARGPIVDEAALCAALAAGRLAGAGLDVFDREPLPPDHALMRLPNGVLTSHIGWPTDEAYANFSNAAADVLLAYLDGREFPRFAANANVPDRLYSGISRG